MTKVYDVIIIGSGPSGYTAAIYAARANLSVLMFQGYETGGQLTQTSDVENYPGFEEGILGPEMMEKFEAQARRFGTEMLTEDVTAVDFSKRPFTLTADSGEYQARANEFKALLIFDEVISGFRVTLGGMQERIGIMPDLTCLGKIIGGGLPVGAYGGRREIMQHVAPLGPMYQAGTLSGNPLAMAAGIATLNELRKPGQYEKLEQKGQLLAESLTRVIHETGVPVQFVRFGALFCLFFTAQRVFDYASAKTSDTACYARFFWNMLSRGVYLPPSQFETCFISLALEDEMIEETVNNIAIALRESFE